MTVNACILPSTGFVHVVHPVRAAAERRADAKYTNSELVYWVPGWDQATIVLRQPDAISVFSHQQSISIWQPWATEERWASWCIQFFTDVDGQVLDDLVWYPDGDPDAGTEDQWVTLAAWDL